MLRELGLPSSGLVRSLLAFNLGVEVGQIAIVGSLWPLLYWVNRQPWAPTFRIGVSVLIFLFGSSWFLQRTFHWNLLPF